jgi:hypothetical protein
MSDQLEFKISESLIRPIIDAKIQSAIVEAMGGEKKMVADMVSCYMAQKVDCEGKVSRYSSDKARFDYLVGKMLEDAMKEALSTYLKEKTELLQKEFEKFFNSKKGTSLLIKAMQEGLCAGLSDKWRTTVTFSPPRE